MDPTAEEVVNMDVICRLCANIQTELIPLFDGEGQDRHLPDRISKYLDFSVHMTEGMPSSVCVQCTLNILNWHNFYQNCDKTNQRFREMLIANKKKGQAKLHALDEMVLSTAVVIEEEEDSDDDVGIDFDEDSSAFNNILINELESAEQPLIGEAENEHGIPAAVAIGENIDELPAEVFEDEEEEMEMPEDDKEGVIENTETVEALQPKTGRRKLPRVSQGLISSASFYVVNEDPTLGIGNNDDDCDDDRVDLGGLGVREDGDLLNEIISEDERQVEDIEPIVDDNENDDDEMMFSMVRDKLTEAISQRLLDESPEEQEPKTNSKRLSSNKELNSAFERDNGAFQCPHCPDPFPQPVDFAQHMSTVHGYNENQLIAMLVKLDKSVVERAECVRDGVRYFKCGECGKLLKSVNSLSWHSLIHKDQRFFKCNLCEKSFRLYSGLSRHIQESHYKIKTFKCTECGTSFANKKNLQEHQNIHTGSRPYECGECGKTFTQRSSLFVHKRSHNKTFPFHCDVCKAGFRTKPVLVNHMRIHTNEKPFECNVCQRRFRLNYEMHLHMSTHSDEKPFKCDQCTMQFRQKRYLLRHTKKYHPN